MDIQEYLAYVRSTAHLGEIELEGKPKRGKKKRKTKLERRVDSLSPDLAVIVLGVLRGDLATVIVRGEMYALRVHGDAYIVQAMVEGSVQRTVQSGRCSCEDNKFRNRVCKHLEAVEKLTT